MQSIYNYTCIPETNRVSRVCSVAVMLYLQFMLRGTFNVISYVECIVLVH
jgi:hypothetical protein